MPKDEDKPWGYGAIRPQDAKAIWRGKDERAIKALMKIYGDDTETVLNALHSLAARIGIAAEVDPVLFSKGVSYHWQSVVDHIEECRAKAAN